MKKTANQETVTLQAIAPKSVKIRIVGDSDLVLNKMSDPTIRGLKGPRNGGIILEKPSVWEQIITSMHWYKGTPKEYTEEGLAKAFEDDIPCISAFGLKKSFGDAVVRNEIDKYKTKFDAGVNVIAKGNLVPITFAEHYIDEKLMSPKKGSPVLARLNRFVGWSAEVEISYLDNVYSLEQIINIINLAGFGLGIGSGRTSGYGRYHVESIV